MRLINVHTRLLEEFIGDEIPEYAILSHTWEEEEVTYARYMSGEYERMKGYYKINMTCRMAAEEHLHYVWVDTCCIDKSSSAELSESIDSMFRWYQGARVCYAYLSDLRPGADWTESLPRCRWFSRGWTLQELIAPFRVVFFDAVWDTTLRPRQRTRRYLAVLLSDITGIDYALLTGQSHLNNRYCAARKMSWAASRNTTRVEDKAYCLLGLFDVNMPLLYGEGDKAFIRLQEEILQSTADLSILAWRLPDHLRCQITGDLVEQDLPITGFMAQSAADFLNCGEYWNIADEASCDVSVTNMGIKLRASLNLDRFGHTLSLSLPCVESGASLALRLLYLGKERYLRIHPVEKGYLSSSAHDLDTPTDRYLLTKIPMTGFGTRSQISSMIATKSDTRKHVLRIVPLDESQRILNPWPADCYDRADQTFFVRRDRAHAVCTVDCLLSFRMGFGIRIRIIALGWSTNLEHAEFGIVGYKEYQQPLDEIQEVTRSYGTSVGQFSLDLKTRNIPRVTSIHHTVPGTDNVAVITLHPTRQDLDRQFCTNSDCTLTLSATMFDAAKVPPIQQMEWGTESGSEQSPRSISSHL